MVHGTRSSMSFAGCLNPLTRECLPDSIYDRPRLRAVSYVLVMSVSNSVGPWVFVFGTAVCSTMALKSSYSGRLFRVSSFARSAAQIFDQPVMASSCDPNDCLGASTNSYQFVFGRDLASSWT